LPNRIREAGLAKEWVDKIPQLAEHLRRAEHAVGDEDLNMLDKLSAMADIEAARAFNLRGPER
jgi:hypothetical protein